MLVALLSALGQYFDISLLFPSPIHTKWYFSRLFTQINTLRRLKCEYMGDNDLMAVTSYVGCETTGRFTEDWPSQASKTI